MSTTESKKIFTTNPVSKSYLLAKRNFLIDLKSNDPKPQDQSLWIIYLITFICVFVLLTAGVMIVLYIWNRRSVSNNNNTKNVDGSVNIEEGNHKEAAQSVHTNSQTPKNRHKNNRKPLKTDKASKKDVDTKLNNDNNQDQNKSSAFRNSFLISFANLFSGNKSNKNRNIKTTLAATITNSSSARDQSSSRLALTTIPSSYLSSSSSSSSASSSSTSPKLTNTITKASISIPAPNQSIVTSIHTIQPQQQPDESFYTGNNKTVSLATQNTIEESCPPINKNISSDNRLQSNLAITSKPSTTSAIAIPVTTPAFGTASSSLCSSSSRSHHQRAKNKGLLESRRGSRTSLTLSLSPSIDSMNSSAAPRSPSPPSLYPGGATAHTPSLFSHHHRPHSRYQHTSPVHQLLSQHHDTASSDPQLHPSGFELQPDLTLLKTSSSFLSVDKLAERVHGDTDILFQEFWSLPMNHATQAQLCISGMVNKNRYKTILPNEKTRVILPKVDDNLLSTYINANYIRGYHSNHKRRFIATQGPMTQTITDFWRMVWYTKASSIVMLTKLMENKKRKCEYYLPSDLGVKDVHQNISVSIESISQMEGFVVRKLKIQEESSSPSPALITLHYWFTSWPDHGSPSPETTTHLLTLVDAVEFNNLDPNISPPPPPLDEDEPTFRLTAHPVPLEKDESSQNTHQEELTDTKKDESSGMNHQNNNSSPVIVHCSAGLGRTGCFLALCTGVRQLYYESGVNILSIVARMRLDRGGLVSNNEQYEYLHRALLQYSQSSRIVAKQQRQQTQSNQATNTDNQSVSISVTSVFDNDSSSNNTPTVTSPSSNNEEVSNKDKVAN